MALWTKHHKDGSEVKNGWICDACDSWNNRITKFCPSCGEPMKGRITNVQLTSVDEFIHASDWTDWVDKPTQDIYVIYWRWCMKNGFPTESKIMFMRTVLSKIPDLRSSPMKGVRYFRQKN